MLVLQDILKVKNLNGLINVYFINMEKYILVSYPEVEKFMEHSGWNECVACVSTDGHPCPDGTWAVPESMYRSMYEHPEDGPDIVEIVSSLGMNCVHISEEYEAIIVGYNIDYDGDVYAIVQRLDNGGWVQTDFTDCILLPQEDPSYWYVKFDELRIE